MDDACTNAGIVVQTTLQARAWAIESHRLVMIAETASGQK